MYTVRAVAQPAACVNVLTFVPFPLPDVLQSVGQLELHLLVLRVQLAQLALSLMLNVTVPQVLQQPGKYSVWENTKIFLSS